MIIDAHCHVWPDAIAARALAGSVEGKRFGDGRVADLIESMDRAAIDRCVCLAVANGPDRVENANRFVGSLEPNRFIGFGSIHPRLSVEENIASLRRHGLRGAKVHPYFQNYSLDDPRLWDIFDAMQGEFAVIAHIGAAGSDDGARCTPAMARNIALEFPRLSFIACHFGGYWRLDDAEREVIGCENIYIDTSWPPGVGEIGPDRVRDLIERHGSERVLFASDWPMADQSADRIGVERLGFDEDTLTGILGGNLERMLGLDCSA